ncbi:MAG: hypothetical protein WAN75_09735, partial [Xanthobacteraceae bacterium]
MAVEKADHRHCQLLRARRDRPRRHAAEEGNELAPSHELSSKKADNLAYHLTAGALCIAAKYSCLCRFRVIRVEGSRGRPSMHFR